MSEDPPENSQGPRRVAFRPRPGLQKRIAAPIEAKLRMTEQIAFLLRDDFPTGMEQSNCLGGLRQKCCPESLVIG